MASHFSRISKRLSHNGEFIGVLEVSVLPSNFFKFFAALAYMRGLQYALIRQDGLFLARYPEVPVGSANQLGPQTGFAGPSRNPRRVAITTPPPPLTAWTVAMRSAA